MAPDARGADAGRSAPGARGSLFTITAPAGWPDGAAVARAAATLSIEARIAGADDAERADALEQAVSDLHPDLVVVWRRRSLSIGICTSNERPADRDPAPAWLAWRERIGRTLVTVERVHAHRILWRER